MKFWYSALYYKVYKLYEKRGESQPHIYAWGVTSLVIVLHFLLIEGMLSYMLFPSTFFNAYGIVLAALSIHFTNYFICNYNRKYIEIIAQFEQHQKRKLNRVIIVYLVILVFLNVFIAGTQRTLYQNIDKGQKSEVLK